MTEQEDIDRVADLREWYAEGQDHHNGHAAALEEATLLTGMFNGAWLDAQQFPPLEYAVPGIIPEGFGLVVSPPKAGKSWLVCGIGLACAKGGVALGKIRVARRPVLYMALEDGQRRLQSRCRHLTCGEAIPAGIHFITAAKTPEVIPMITEFIERHRDQKPLIILDTLGKVKPPRRPGDDGYQQDYAIGNALKAAVDAVPGVTLLVVHHTRKAESSDFVDAVSGTQGIAGSADFVLVLARKRHQDDAVLSVTGRDIPEAEYALTVREGIWQLDGPSLAAASEIAERRRLSDTRSDRSVEIVSVVAASPKPISPAEVSEKLNIDNDTVGRYLRRLTETGLIARAGRGLYVRVSEASERPKDSPFGQADTSDRVSQCDCGNALLLDESIASGKCMECSTSGQTADRP
ncbi:AAA family ATPase [Mycobacterium sp. 1482292.6]|uniref:AAA family ATPase n=1 Tax=Mycobacterium sp. 1482292.6 TaxID=1834081 RepID=UPI0009F232AB|nr:AAA family ATPase [Mycobacterium sp. 1482292.6]